MNTDEWRAQGMIHRVGNHALFCVDTGGDKPPLVILHGYPTSSYDYWRVLPLLTERFRVIIHDHIGFGFSDKPRDYSYSLFEQADHALMLWRNLDVTEAHLLAHDYGTSVATEILARRNLGHEPVKLHSLTLCNGSMHIEMANLRLIQKLLNTPRVGEVIARVASERLFRRNIRKLFVDSSGVSDDELRGMFTLMMGDGGRAVAPEIIHYLDERHKFWHRWIGALRATKDLPVHIVWARQDPIAVEQMAHVLHGEISTSDLQLLDNAGHFPMIEVPGRWAEAVLSALPAESPVS